MSRRIQTVCVAFLGVLTLSGCGAISSRPDAFSGSEPTARQISDAGEGAGDAAMAEGKPADATSLYAHAWDARPTASLAVKRGVAMRLSGDSQGAVVFLREASQRFSSDAAIFTELGRSSMSGGYLPEAEAALNKAVTLSNANWNTFAALGVYKARSGDLEGAQASFQNAYSRATNDKDRISAQANIAMLRAQKGDTEGAILDLEELVRHPGLNPKVHSALALLYGLKGDMNSFRREAAAADLSPDAVTSVSNWLAGGEVAAPATTSSPRASTPERRRITPARQSTQSARPLASRQTSAPTSSTSKVNIRWEASGDTTATTPRTRMPEFNPGAAMGIE